MAGARDKSERLGHALILLMVGLGLVLRLVYLSEFPAGIHGDEAWTGLRSADVLANGTIGFWDSEHSVGQPAGQTYASALQTLVFGRSIWSLRLASALAACAALLCFAIFARLTLKHSLPAAVAISFYALADFEILLGRVAFPPIWGQVCVTASLALVALAVREKCQFRGAVMASGGALLGASPMFYSGPIGVALAMFVLVPLWLRYARAVRAWRLFGLFAGGFAMAVAPMALAYLLGTEAMPRGAVKLPSDALDYLHQLRRAAYGLFVGPMHDGIDGTGMVQAFPFSLGVLALGGLAVALFGGTGQWRLALPLLGVLASAIAFTAVFLAVDSGLYRRAMAALIPLCWLAGNAASGRGVLVAVLMIGLCGAEAAARMTAQIGSQELRFVYCEATTRTAQAIERLNLPEARVYFASVRHSWRYEILRYLLPDQNGVDVSAEFSVLPSPMLASFEPGAIVALAEGYLDLAPEFGQRPDVVDRVEVKGSGGEIVGFLFVLAR